VFWHGTCLKQGLWSAADVSVGGGPHHRAQSHTQILHAEKELEGKSLFTNAAKLAKGHADRVIRNSGTVHEEYKAMPALGTVLGALDSQTRLLVFLNVILPTNINTTQQDGRVLCCPFSNLV
jgi:hypothetical protein